MLIADGGQEVRKNEQHDNTSLHVQILCIGITGMYFEYFFRPRKSIDKMLGDAPPDAIDLLKKLLHFNPDKRLTTDQALKHPYVKRYVSESTVIIIQNFYHA